MPQDRTLANLQRKLDRWELNHLRALAAQQEERIGLLETELEIAQEHAEFWHDQATNMVEELQADGKTVGLTQNGDLVLAPQDAPADDLCALVSKWRGIAKSKFSSARVQDSEDAARFIEHGATCYANCAIELSEALERNARSDDLMTERRGCPIEATRP